MSMSRDVTADDVYQKLIEENITQSEGSIEFELADTTVQVESKDVIGRILEDWLGQWMKENDIEYSERDNSQLPPDFYLSSDNNPDKMLEVKAFNKNRGAGFDIADFRGYCDDIINNPKRLNANYLVFEYDMDGKTARITRLWLKNVWELAGHSGANPLKLQVKRGDIYNIRPVTWYSDRATYDSFDSKEELLEALYETLMKHDTIDSSEYDGWLQEMKENYYEATGITLRL